MEKKELDEKIVEVSRSIFSYCVARTPNQYDAEDLAQEIILEIYKSAANIRNDKAFYGFMWSVAGNVYKQWCKKRLHTNYGELQEEIQDGAEEIFFSTAEDSDILLLRRELTLLAAKYRHATVLYYLEEKSCSEIAKILSVSESMVKYLLFKSRQIVKDGMDMERKYGEQSYHPRKLNFRFWGSVNHYGRACDSKIAQNILFACYNDKLTEEQISLCIGVALPYMEDALRELEEYGLLCKDGRRFYTNMVIITKESQEEIAVRTKELQKRIVATVKKTLEEKEAAIRKIGFCGADMDRNTFSWQITCILLQRAIIEKLQSKASMDCPADKFGERCFRWCEEDYEGSLGKSGFALGKCSMSNEAGDEIQFMDFSVNGEMVHHYFFPRQDLANIFLDIAGGRKELSGENDRNAAADMVKHHYVKNVGGKLSVNAPVFRRDELESLLKLLDEDTERIAAEAEELLAEVAKILQNYFPVHLKKQAGAMACLRMLGDAISVPVRLLYEEQWIRPKEAGAMLPTTYIVRNE